MLTIQKAWDTARILWSLCYAGIIDIGCTYTICTNAEDAQNFVKVLIFLHEKNLLTSESCKAIREHAKQSEYIFTALEYLHTEEILNENNLNTLCGHLDRIEEIVDAFECLYNRGILNQYYFDAIYKDQKLAINIPKYDWFRKDILELYIYIYIQK